MIYFASPGNFPIVRPLFRPFSLSSSHIPTNFHAHCFFHKSYGSSINSSSTSYIHFLSPGSSFKLFGLFFQSIYSACFFSLFIQSIFWPLFQSCGLNISHVSTNFYAGCLPYWFSNHLFILFFLFFLHSPPLPWEFFTLSGIFFQPLRYSPSNVSPKVFQPFSQFLLCHSGKNKRHNEQKSCVNHWIHIAQTQNIGLDSEIFSHTP